MTHVSKRKIKKEDYYKIYNQFVEIVSRASAKNGTKKFLKEFFYPTERIMFAKRIGILFMIIEEIPDRVISESLSVSTSTIWRVYKRHNNGEYEFISFLIKKNRSVFLDILEFVLISGLPSKAGRSRYTWFEELQKKIDKPNRNKKSKTKRR